MSIFEAIMLLCFGAAWPASIYKSLKSRSTGGKSPVFLVILILGYAAGITHKVFFSRDIVLCLYILNILMVSFDLVLYFRNRREEKKAESGK